MPEWGLTGVDDPAFVRHMCTFVDDASADRDARLLREQAGLAVDLGDEAGSRAAYRKCMTPLAGDFPAWAAGNVPGAGAGAPDLALTPNPQRGRAARRAVRGSTPAHRPDPALAALLRRRHLGGGRSGRRPVTRRSSVRRWTGLPGDARRLSLASVRPRKRAVLRLRRRDRRHRGEPSRQLQGDSGQAPLAATFQTDLVLPVAPSHWRIVFGDGKSREGDGAPPHFAGHTYPEDGTYHVLLEVDVSPASRYLAAADVTVTTAAPPTGTPTGTVLVNGAPFTGGQAHAAPRSTSPTAYSPPQLVRFVKAAHVAKFADHHRRGCKNRFPTCGSAPSTADTAVAILSAFRRSKSERRAQLAVGVDGGRSVIELAMQSVDVPHVETPRVKEATLG